MRGAEREQGIERWALPGCAACDKGVAFEEPCVHERMDGQDMVADGDAGLRLGATRTKEAEWKILDGEVRVAVGVLHPGPQLRIVRFVAPAIETGGHHFGSGGGVKRLCSFCP